MEKLSLKKVEKISLRYLKRLDENWTESKQKPYENVDYVDAREIKTNYLTCHLAIENIARGSHQTD